MGQQDVNKLQSDVNDRQQSINKRQTIIDERSRIDLTIPAFWGIIVLVVSLTSFYLVTTFNTASDIRDIKTNITFIKNGLETHLSTSAQAQKDMRVISAERDKKFSEIDKTLTTIKYVLNLP